MRAPRTSRAAPTIVPARALAAGVRARAVAAVTQAEAAGVRAEAAAHAVKIDPAAAAAAVRVAAAALRAGPAAMRAAAPRAVMRTRIVSEITAPGAVLMTPLARKTAYAIGRVRAARSQPVPPAMAAQTEIGRTVTAMDGEAITIVVA